MVKAKNSSNNSDKALKEAKAKIVEQAAEIARLSNTQETVKSPKLGNTNGIFHPSKGEKPDKSGYYSRDIDGTRIQLKDGDDIAVKLKQIGLKPDTV